MKFLTRHLMAAIFALGALLAFVVMAPSASAYPGDTGGVSVGTTTPTEGGSLAVNGTSCAPNSTVSISLDGSTDLGTASTDADGNYSTTVSLPSGTTGDHTVEVSGASCSAVEDISIASSSSSSGGSGGLASTGVAVVGIGALGVVLLVGGGLMLLAGRRRKISA